MAQSTEQMRRDLEALRQECARLKGVKAELAATAVLAISDAVRASLVRASSPAARLGVNRCGSRFTRTLYAVARLLPSSANARWARANWLSSPFHSASGESRSSMSGGTPRPSRLLPRHEKYAATGSATR